MVSISHNLDRESSRLVYGWLLFAVSSLIFAGIFAFLVAMARTPFIQDLFPRSDYIRVALVGHVNLSVVIWFLAFQGTLWTLTHTCFINVKTYSMAANWLGLWLSVAGTLLVIASSLLGLGIPLFINYVPVLTHPVFYAGLLLLTAGIALTLVNTFLTAVKARMRKTYTGDLPSITFGMMMSGIAAASAIICFGLSYYFQLYGPNSKVILDLEMLFWGGGHILQFANTIAMVTVWIYLTTLIFKKFPVKETYAKILYAYYLLFILAAPFIYFIHDTASQAYKDSFTALMKHGLGPSTGIFGMAILFTIFSNGRGTVPQRIKALPWKDPLFASLVVSMAVFALGGIIALLIYGTNTKIPSHYHGVIGGVTLAFMGITHHLIRVLKREVCSRKMAILQPYIYGAGQTLFVVGMFMAGSHGVQRKTFGAAQNLDSLVKIAGMAIVGIGGLIAIIGGIIFVINSIISLTGKQRNDIQQIECSGKTITES